MGVLGEGWVRAVVGVLSVYAMRVCALGVWAGLVVYVLNAHVRDCC